MLIDKQTFHAAMLLWGSIFCLLVGICAKMNRSSDKKKWDTIALFELTAAFLLVNDSLAWIFRGYPGILGYWMVRISNFFVFLFSDLIMLVAHIYLTVQIYGTVKKSLESKERVIVKLQYAICFLASALVIISQFTNLYYYFDADNFYHRNPGYFVSVLLPLMGTLLELYLVVKYRKEISKSLYVTMLNFLLLPLFGMLALFFIYGISLANIAIGISSVLIFVQAIIEQNQELARHEKKNADMKIALMLSQISPHFLYNVLNTIQYLCDEDSNMAKETIGELAVWLRGNMDSLTQKANITFDQEMYYVKNYLSIEKKRFGERLQVAYDIQFRDFKLPSLTLQTMVENAVKHGVSKRIDGGKILISTRCEEHYVEIRVEDDGIGFDPKQIQIKDSEGNSHIGIHIVRERLKRMVNGELFIQSEKNKGTLVSIRIPK